MARLLFLAHRMPYPPDKGDKIRSFHLLRHLARRHEVALATFIDDPDDEAHRATVQAMCSEAHFVRLRPRAARLRSLGALLAGEPLTLRYYRSASMQRWIGEAARHRPFDAAVVFSSSMAPYAEALPGTPMLLDLVDVDSAKWSAYAPRHRWPLSWPLAREGRTLLAYERHAVAQARHSFLCTDNERELFESLAPELKGRVDVMRNGVDAEFYAPDPARPSPFSPRELPLVFTGAMDYWPNVDAVRWFAGNILPPLRRCFSGLRFHIVGRNPTPAVRELASEVVNVTGTVPDVRPYLQHAAVVVAPLRVARGIQNKVLEAMAMGRPVVTTSPCATALQARLGEHMLGADTEEEFIAALAPLLADPARARAIGAAGRRCVQDGYSWPTSLALLDARLAQTLQGPRTRTAMPAAARAAALQEGS